MYFGEFRESRTGSNIIFRGWGGEKDVEWAGRKGRAGTGLPLAFIIMSSDPNLYSMASGTLWNTYCIFHKEKPSALTSSNDVNNIWATFCDLVFA